MKFSYNWLKEVSKTKKNSKKLAEMVGLRAFEFEGEEDLAKRFEKIVVGEILEIRKHPDADKLQIVKVDVGTKTPLAPLHKGGDQTLSSKKRDERGILRIVCGASNIEVGQKVPVALVGAVLPLENMEIKETEIRGEKSYGMLCAEDELGLGKDHSGILILDGPHLSPPLRKGKKIEVGMPLVKALELDDAVLEFDVLPNRAHDCLSYEGLAREISAMEGRKLKTNNEKLRTTTQNSKLLSIKIEDKELCPRYIGAVLEDVKIGSSPQWMQARLVASGMEPINNVVDITNYVMLETGSPLHAFDGAKIRNPGSANRKAEIVIRKAKRGEQLELLDGTKLELHKDDLVICNAEKPMALAGIKGGKDSGINNSTNAIVLEAANFQGLNIRLSRQRHALNTESQTRFEKGLAPELAERAAVRAIQLLQEYAGAKLVETVDADYSSSHRQEVTLEFERMKSLLACEIDSGQAIEILKRLGFEVIKKNAKEVKMRVPFWRLDVEGPEDLMEEVARIVGYDRIEESPMMMPVEPPRKNKEREFEHQLAEALIGLGFDEVRNYSFYSVKDIDVCGIAGDHIELENPLSEELTLLRTSMLPGILRNVALNQKYFSGFSIFEIGRVYDANRSTKDKSVKGQTDKESLKLAGAVFCEKHQKGDAYYLAKGKIEALLGEYNAKLQRKTKETDEQVGFRSAKEFSNKVYHPTRSAKIFWGEKEIGEIGEISSEVMREYFFKKKAVVFEMDFASLQELAEREKKYIPLRKFPMILRDVSMYVDYQTEAGDFEEIIRKAGGENLQKIELFDVYADQKNNRKSLAFHLAFGKEDSTMKSKEADQQTEKIITALEKSGAKVRKE